MKTVFPLIFRSFRLILTAAVGLAAGHLYNFQDPDVTDEEGETAAIKASRNGDLAKLEMLALGCADFNKADSYLNLVSMIHVHLVTLVHPFSLKKLMLCLIERS